jgi:hypothetical protein
VIELPQYKDWLESESGYRAHGIPIHSEVWRACLEKCKPIIEGLEAEIARQAIAFQSGREVGHSEARTALFSLEEMEQQIAEAVLAESGWWWKQPHELREQADRYEANRAKAEGGGK